MNKNGRNTGISAALASALFLGLTPIFGKQALTTGFSPLAVVTLRTAMATGLLIIAIGIFRRGFFYIYPVGLAGCVLAGFLNGLGSILYYTALNRLDASIGHLIYSFYPLFVALWQRMDSQPISRLTLFRLLLSLPGVYLLVSAGQQNVDWLGAGLMMGSAALYALHLLVNQRVLYEVPAPTVTLYTLMSMTLTVSIAFAAFDRSLPVSGTPWWPILGMAGITFLSRITLFLGVKHLGGMQTALLGLGELLVTVFLAQVWLGERLSPLQWIGALFLGGSLFLIGFEHPAPQKRHTAGWLAWLDPPGIRPDDLPWNSNP